MAVTVTRYAGDLLGLAARRLCTASVARSRQHLVELALEHGLDQFAYPLA
jgi:hypothetical protein